MSDLQAPIAPIPTDAPAALGELARLSNTFSAPSKTFGEIALGRKSWWLPFLLMIIFSYAFFGVVSARIGWHTVAENTMHMNPKAEARLAQATPEASEQAIKFTETITKSIFLATPLVLLFTAVLVTLLFWGTINFGFGGKADFVSVLTVSFYAWLPSLIKSALGIVVTFFTAPESFNLANAAPTNLGAFLNPLETNAALYKLATAIDVTTIWTLVLFSIGLAVVAKTKRSTGYITVFGWWGLATAIGVGLAAL
ncbi:YIP1 family protein [Telmatobacter bradus]|uniref:YIP1 family protein n=1 Tax=Telmatobacter bradus TaxID=474953 RepID=UPI003B42FDCC